jgi:ParB family chromosome partitioning protein
MSNNLGRGLGSLIPQKINKATVIKDETVKALLSDEGDKLLQIDPEKIKINPLQPRKRFDDDELQGLMQSIQEYGIIQPLVVTSLGDGYELIAGERRLRASIALGLKKVPVVVREANKQKKLEIALVENVQREDLNPVEKALAYQRLIDEFGMTHEEVGKKVGKSRPRISNSLRLLQLPEEIQLALIEGKIASKNALLIVGLDSEAKQLALFRKVMNQGFGYDEMAKESRRMGGTKEAKIKINYRDKDKEFAFREFFGTKAEIIRMRTGGKVIINFYSDEELEELAKKVKGV